MKALRDAWADTLVELGRTNPDIVVLDGDLATSTRAERFAVAFPDRFFQMGIAEQNLVGTAVGMATLGFVPWLSSFAVFFTHRAVDQVRMLVAQTHANVKIAAGYSGILTGYTGKTHQDVEDLAILRAMPGMTVLAPGDEHECAAMVRWATETHGPVYLRLARDAGPALFDDEYLFEPGRVRPLRSGSDVVLVSTGPQTARCLEAAGLLAADGVSAGVVHVPSIKPIDAPGLLDAIRPVRLVVTVEEHTILGGLGGLVAEIVTSSEPRRVVRIGIEDRWGESAPNAFLLDRHGLSPARVAERVARELAGTSTS